MEIVAFDELAHSQDNVGSSCVDIRNHGSNGCLLEQEGLRLQGSGWEHLPTGHALVDVNYW
jgi:hypothetical protein